MNNNIIRSCFNINDNRILFKRFIDHLSMNGEFNYLRSLGCKIENIKDEYTCPVYINFELPDTILVPFIAISSPSEMIDGKLVTWLGIDNSDMTASISVVDFSTHKTLAKLIKKETKSCSVMIDVFCEYAFKVNELTHKINSQTIPRY